MKLRDVVLADAPARESSRGGAGLDLARRALLGAAAAAALLAAGCVGVSYAGNRRLQRDVADAARAIAALPPGAVDLPSVDALRRLEALRERVARLRAYEREGPPLRLRMGLYAGDDLLPEARRRYFDALDRLILGAARGGLVSTLRALPAEPTATSDYGAAYDALKAYLITTAQPARSSPEFLTPVLTRQWLAGRPLDAERAELAKRQLDYYATELPAANPYAGEPEAAAVARARDFLSRFAGTERVYQFMLSEASRQAPPAAFARRVPGAAGVVSNAYEVPGAFTKAGWRFMEQAFKDVDRFFGGEPWVVGERQQVQVDKARLVADLRARYAAAYVDHWRRYLRAGAVAPFRGVKDAADKLAALGGNQSPLLAMLALAARNTDVDSTVAAAFQPVHAVSPPADTTKYIVEANAAYVNALAQLQSSVAQVAAAPPGQGEAPAQQAAQNASAARLATTQLAQGFRIDGQTHLETTVQRLLEAPIAHAEPLLRNFGAADLNARGAPVCGVARGILAKLPFSADATAQATMAEVSAFLRPGTGTLWTFYDQTLQRAVQRQGNQFTPVAGSVTVAPELIALLNRAAAFSAAIFPEGENEPRMLLTVEPQLVEGTASVSITVDGQTVRSTRNARQSARITWTGGTAREARLAAQIGAAEVTLLSFTGPWSLFQLLREADSWTPGPAAGTYRVEWALRTRGQTATLPDGSAFKVAADIALGPVPPAIFRRTYFQGTACPGQIAR